MTSDELRKKYIDFFKSKGHAEIPSAPLVPANDPTVLFTTAGMHPLVPYLLGEKHPAGNRLVGVQKCIRTGDIDEVGDDTHLTFFEMLGNWSLGDYFKEDAIRWSWEFLTDSKWLRLPAKRLAFSCFSGDADALRDDESAELWMSCGVSKERIAFLGKEDNWWGPAGITGPCGPDTEMFYWVGDPNDPVLQRPFQETHSDKRWVEIWNDVFMQYNKTAEGKFELLSKPNVDTGMGLERTLTALNGKKSVYETDLFTPIFDALRVDGKDKKARIIADHIKTACFMISDGVEPSNKDRGYVVRRILRQAAVYARQASLDLQDVWVGAVIVAVAKIYKDVYPEIWMNAPHITQIISAEQKKFGDTLEKGLKEFLKKKFIDGKTAFDLYQTYGFPWELTRELAEANGQKINKEEFKAEFKKHQDLSRTSSAGIFKGGLADHSEKVVRLHTATHLMNKALRRVLGEHVWQRGSHINAERTRFDFTHQEKMTPEQIKKVEELVNGWILRDLAVKKEIMPLEEARGLNAIGAFGEKYGQTVSVYTVHDSKTEEVISREFCGGPHVEHTGVIGKFKIIKEEAIAAGIRRVKAVVE
ncbi:MAG: alanine--tRNA ligase [bacterium]|nr:alanine--tRNA ligase [bacterium]